MPAKPQTSAIPLAQSRPPGSAQRAPWLVTVLAVAAFCSIALGAPVAQAGDARYEGSSEVGDVAVFSTTDKLVSGDTDIQSDVYVRDIEEGLGYVTREISLGPTGGNDAFTAQFLAIDPGGETVFFATKERLTASDDDKAEDVYARDLVDNETQLVSAGDPSCAGSGCGNGGFDASAAPGGIVNGGAKVFFLSAERLSSEDLDSGPDIYMRDLQEGRTELVSTATSSCSGSCGGETKPIVFQGASEDGSKAIFTTDESLSIEDEDELSDLYERNLAGPGGETKLVSMPGGAGSCPTASCEPVNSHISPSGAHVFFETNERIDGGDSDAFQDVYDWAGVAPTLISTGPTGGNGEANALFGGSSASGDDVFFTTVEPLVASDEDAAQDVYMRSGGVSTELVSAGDPSCAGAKCGSGSSPTALQWVAGDGSLALLSSVEPLTAADSDTRADVYARTLPSGPTTLVSVPGPTCTDPECGKGYDATFYAASTDGSHLFFVTDEALTPPASGDSSGPGDRDEQTDVYDRSGGTTTLVSAGQLTGNGPYSGNGPFDAQLPGASADGAKAFVVTNEQLTAEDSDAAADVYVRGGGGTLLISRNNDTSLEAELAPPGPALEETDPESPNAATSIKVIGAAQAEAGVKVYSSPTCTGQPIGTGSAETLAEPGIAVTVGAGTTTFYATAEADGFVSACTGALSYTQQSGASGGGSKPAAKKASEPGPLVRIPHLIPQTRITFGPAFKTRARRPIFRFTDATGQSGTSFECKLDRSRWKPCGSPTKLKKLDRGRHVFAVLGVNADGVAEEHPVKRKFKVVPR